MDIQRLGAFGRRIHQRTLALADERQIYRLSKAFFEFHATEREGETFVWLQWLYVLPDHRGKGHAKAVLDLFKEAARAADISIVLVARPFEFSKPVTKVDFNAPFSQFVKVDDSKWKALDSWYRRQGFIPLDGFRLDESASLGRTALVFDHTTPERLSKPAPNRPLTLREWGENEFRKLEKDRQW